MGLIEIDWNPSRPVLRQFGAIWLPAFLAVAGLSLTGRTGSWALAGAAWGVAAVVAALGLLRPERFRPVFVGWMLAAYPVGWAVSHLVLAAVFYGVITPAGLALRLAGHDPMARRLDRSAATYWSRREPVAGVSRYFRQF